MASIKSDTCSEYRYNRRRQPMASLCRKSLLKEFNSVALNSPRRDRVPGRHTDPSCAMFGTEPAKPSRSQAAHARSIIEKRCVKEVVRETVRKMTGGFESETDLSRPSSKMENEEDSSNSKMGSEEYTSTLRRKAVTVHTQLNSMARKKFKSCSKRDSRSTTDRILHHSQSALLDSHKGSDKENIYQNCAFTRELARVEKRQPAVKCDTNDIVVCSQSSTKFGYFLDNKLEKVKLLRSACHKFTTDGQITKEGLATRPLKTGKGPVYVNLPAVKSDSNKAAGNSQSSGHNFIVADLSNAKSGHARIADRHAMHNESLVEAQLILSRWGGDARQGRQADDAIVLDASQSPFDVAFSDSGHGGSFGTGSPTECGCNTDVCSVSPGGCSSCRLDDTSFSLGCSGHEMELLYESINHGPPSRSEECPLSPEYQNLSALEHTYASIKSPLVSTQSPQPPELPPRTMDLKEIPNRESKCRSRQSWQTMCKCKDLQNSEKRDMSCHSDNQVLFRNDYHIYTLSDIVNSVNRLTQHLSTPDLCSCPGCASGSHLEIPCELTNCKSMKIPGADVVTLLSEMTATAGAEGDSFFI